MSERGRGTIWIIGAGLAATALGVIAALYVRAGRARPLLDPREAALPDGAVGVFDVHEHVAPQLLDAALRFAAHEGIYGFVNLSGGHAGGSLEVNLRAAAPYGRRVLVFMNLDWDGCCAPAWQAREVAQLKKGAAEGARGLKIFKALGLAVEDEQGRRVPVDADALAPIWDACAELHLPVAIHVGDPKAFFEPLGPNNERMDELASAPDWSFADRSRFPSWEALHAEFVSLVAKHPRTTFIGVHFGNDPEDPEEVGRMLDRFPNLYVDTAARVPEIGRERNWEATRRVILAHPDRVLFGTDVQWLASRSGRVGLVLGAGDAVLSAADPAVGRFFSGSSRFFETFARDIPSPTPIQGRWNVEGIGLPPEVLGRLYHGNAERLLGAPPPPHP